jgi:chromosome partitioning protein
MDKDTKIISFATQKGGSGKTTLTHMVALALASKSLNKSVLVLDMDEQKTLSVFYAQQQKLDANLPEPPTNRYELITCPLPELRETLNVNYGKYEYILIDFPGTFMVEGIRSAFLFCDKVFVPVKHSQPDFISSQVVFKLLEEVKEMRKAKGADFDYYGLISIAEPDKSNFKMFKEFLATQSYPSLENPFYKYVKYENALINYHGIMDVPKVKWKHEEEAFNRFFQELYKLITK